MSRRPEQAIQRSVVEHLRCRGARGAVWWHVQNGGYRRPAEAKIMAGLGVRAGVADICAVHNSRFYALELKAPGGRSTAAQIAFRDEINAAGGFATEAMGIGRRAALFGVLGASEGQLSMKLDSTALNADEPHRDKVLTPFDKREALTLQEAARIATVSESTVVRWCNEFHIGRKIGGAWRVSRVALQMKLDDNG